MTNIQLLISIGLPMLVLGVGMWMNSNAINHLRTDMNARFVSVDNRFTDMENRFTAIDNRFTILEHRLTTMENRFADSMDRLIGICNDLDKRLGIIEDRMRLP